MTRTMAMICAAGLLAVACAPSFKTTKAELDMKTYEAAPEAAAVMIERSGRVVLDYREDIDDGSTFKTAGKIRTSGGGGKSGAAVPGMPSAPSPVNTMKRDTDELLRAHNVSSYTLQVNGRIKILTEAGLARAKIEDVFPKEADLESFTAATFLPDGRVIQVQQSQVRTGDGSIRFEMPQARVGAVVEYNYKYHSRDLSTLTGWTFQGDLPVALSAFRFKMLAGTSLPYRFIQTADDQSADPKEKKVLGMDRSEWMELSWELRDLPAAEGGRQRAGIVIGD